MFQKAKRWDVKSIILLALIGILLGAIYQYGVDNFYNVIRLITLPTGYAPVMGQIFAGLWYIAAPLAIYFVPLPGSGLVGEALAATVEMLLGSQFGAFGLLEGLIQGAANEIGFFPKKERYERFSWTSVLIGAACAGLGNFLIDYVAEGYSKYAPQVQIGMLVMLIISALVFNGVLVKLITKLFDRVLKPDLTN